MFIINEVNASGGQDKRPHLNGMDDQPRPVVGLDLCHVAPRGDELGAQGAADGGERRLVDHARQAGQLGTGVALGRQIQQLQPGTWHEVPQGNHARRPGQDRVQRSERVNQQGRGGISTPRPYPSRRSFQLVGRKALWPL